MSCLIVYSDVQNLTSEKDWIIIQAKNTRRVFSCCIDMLRLVMKMHSPRGSFLDIGGGLDDGDSIAEADVVLVSEHLIDELEDLVFDAAH